MKMTSIAAFAAVAVALSGCNAAIEGYRFGDISRALGIDCEPPQANVRLTTDGHYVLSTDGIQGSKPEFEAGLEIVCK